MKRTVMILGVLATLLVSVGGPAVAPAVAAETKDLFEDVLPFPHQWRPGN